MVTPPINKRRLHWGKKSFGELRRPSICLDFASSWYVTVKGLIFGNLWSGIIHSSYFGIPHNCITKLGPTLTKSY